MRVVGIVFGVFRLQVDGKPGTLVAHVLGQICIVQPQPFGAFNALLSTAKNSVCTRVEQDCCRQQLRLPCGPEILQHTPDQSGRTGGRDGPRVWGAAGVSQHRPDDGAVATQKLCAQALYGSDQVLSQLGKAAAQLDSAVLGQCQFHAAITGAAFAKAIAAVD